MTGDEYIILTKQLINVIPGRYENIVRMTFNRLTEMECFRKNGIKIDLKMISSTSILSEVVDTKPALTVIWDNYQWEILEKFLLSALLYINNHKEEAIQTYKLNIYAALSVRLTYAAPELSYVFARRYRELKESLPYEHIALYSEKTSEATDMLYCQLLALGHEFSHILFERMDFGDSFYKFHEDDFFRIMDGGIKSEVLSDYSVNGISLEKLIQDIKKDINKDYRKELICDIVSYSLLGNLIEDLDNNLTPDRSVEELYDDIISMNDFTLRTLHTFSYMVEYWTRFGSYVSAKRTVKPEDLGIYIPNLSIWKSQYYAREYLVSLYMRVILLRDRRLNVSTENQKTTMLYNAIIEITQKFITFEDKEWIEIILEFQQLMNQNIPFKELIKERNNQLGIQ